MKLFRKTKLHTRKGKSRVVYIFDIPVFKYDRLDNKNTKCRFLSLNAPLDKSKQVFYLKVNRDDFWSFKCIQNWVDIIGELNAEIVILSDKPKLNKKILDNIVFPDCNIRFIKSVKNRLLSDIVKNIASPYWTKAAFAHLTTFFHAKNNNINSYWNIDADDTMIMLDKHKSAMLLNTVKTYASENDISMFSLDMHHSKTHGIHWSFGITYTKNPEYWFNVFSKNKNDDWHKKNKYIKYDCNSNIDQFCTYLRDTGKYHKIKTFAVKNLIFAHLSCLTTPYSAHTFYLYNDKKIDWLALPDSEYLKNLKTVPISSDVIMIPFKISADECRECLYENIYNIKLLEQYNSNWTK